MKLDAKLLRYLSSDDFRVLTACEMGSRNHEVVPTQLIANIAQLRGGSIHKIISHLARNNLIAKVQNNTYDGYRLTYGGYDYLALKTLSKRDSVFSIGNQIGVGKESDIIIVADNEQNQLVLKLHRLGRTSFRTIKEKRDYLRNRKTTSWLYMARLAAMKEFAFMQVLYEHGFPVPKPIDQNRHCILMELVDGIPLCQVKQVANTVRLAQSGLIHGDFNEFNLLVTPDGEPILIDFPQMVSTSHVNAQMYFERDVNCIRTFFEKRFNYVSTLYPVFSKSGPDSCELGVGVARLDEIAHASGFSKQQQHELDAFLLQQELETGFNSEEPEDESDSELEELNDELEQVSIEVCIRLTLQASAEEINEHNTLAEHNIKGQAIQDLSEQLKQSESANLQEISVPEADCASNDDDTELEKPENDLHRPHRDSSSKRVPSALQSKSTKAAPGKVLDKAEIRKIVAKSMSKKKGNSSRSKNYSKTTRVGREVAKQHNDFF